MPARFEAFIQPASKQKGFITIEFGAKPVSLVLFQVVSCSL